jgi:hypothetical protein
LGAIVPQPQGAKTTTDYSSQLYDRYKTDSRYLAYEHLVVLPIHGHRPQGTSTKPSCYFQMCGQLGAPNHFLLGAIVPQFVDQLLPKNY